MSLLYEKDVTITVEVMQPNGLITLDFYSNGGKHGTHESLDGYILTPKRLLQILQERLDVTENER